MRHHAFLVLLAAALPLGAQVIKGGGSGNATALQGTPVATTAPANGNCLVYSSSGLNWLPSSCSGTASTAWANLTSGTNAGATMVVGSGASLAATGSGTIAATTAAALAATPSQCTGGQVATGIAASGNANCTASSAGPATAVQSSAGYVALSNAAVGFDTTNLNYHGYFGGADGVFAGLKGSLTSGDIPQISVSGGAVSLTDSGVTAAPSFASVASGTNTTGALVLGSGASLTVAGSGVNNANELNGATVPASAAFLTTNGSAQPIAGTTLGTANGGTGATSLAGANIPVQTGSIATGDCVKWASGTSIEDAGAACGSGGGGGTPSGTNQIQISNSGGTAFTSYAGFKADTTNGYLANLNPSTQTPAYPLDVEWIGLAGGTSAFTLADFNCGLTSTASSPGDLHCFNGDASLSGTSTFSGSGLTDSIQYMGLTDTRAPAAASTVGHEMALFAEVGAEGATNLTCGICAAIWGAANFAGTGETVTDLIDFNGTDDGISGTGTISNGVNFNASLKSVSSGPALDNVVGFLATDPASVAHGTGGSGYVAGVAVGTPATTSTYGYVEASNAGNAFAGGLALGTNSLGSLTGGVVLDAEGYVDIGSDSGGTSPPLCFRSTSSGLATVCINGIAGTQHYKLPSDAATFNGVAGSYDVAGHSGNLSSQTLFAFPDGNSRFFRLEVYGVCTASASGGTVTVTVGYADEVQSQTQSGSAETCSASGNILTYSTMLYAKTSNVTVSTTTASSPTYDLHARLTLVGPNAINSQ